jgi:nitrate/nitrite transporter NarK
MGRLFDLGYFKIPCFAASCVFVACTFLIAECTQYWQFFLAQGLGMGGSGGIIITPALVVVSHWFSPKRRGFALGITAVGSSVGSTMFPAVAQKLIPLIGFVRTGGGTVDVRSYNIRFKWTLRVFGFILIVTMGMLNIVCFATCGYFFDRRIPQLLHRRIPPSNVHGGFFNLKAFRNKAFLFYCISGIFTLLGLNTGMTTVIITATS